MRSTEDVSIDAQLKRWGAWLVLCDDPGLGYPHVNMLGRLRQRYGSQSDWSEAECVNAAVVWLMESWPIIGVALKCWYEFDEQVMEANGKAERVEIRLNTLRFRTGRSITARTFEDYVKQGRRLVKAHMAGQVAA